jgi:hypothetical protein
MKMRVILSKEQLNQKHHRALTEKKGPGQENALIVSLKRHLNGTSDEEPAPTEIFETFPPSNVFAILQ